MSERALSPEGVERVERVMWEGPCDVYAEPLRSNITALVRELEEANAELGAQERRWEAAIALHDRAEAEVARLREALTSIKALFPRGTPIYDIASRALAADDSVTDDEVAASGTYKCPICGRDTPHRHDELRNTSTPEARKIWDDVAAVAAKAPEHLKERVRALARQDGGGNG